MGGRSFENPLLSHARMRGLYRGLVEVRALQLAPAGAEACVVAACIDLRGGDFVLGEYGSVAAEYVRALGARTGSGKPRAAAVRAAREAEQKAFAGTAYEAMLCATGAAMALKAADGDSMAVALIDGNDGKGLPIQSWMRALKVSGAAELPLVIVALPRTGGADLALVGRRAEVPVIPVDASDAVGLYRVMQESVGRARADRRGAVIECVASGSDPVRLMGEQLVAKRIATARWVEAVEGDFHKLLPAAKPAVAARKLAGRTAKV